MDEAIALAAEMMPSSYLLSGIPGAMYYAYYYRNYCGQVPEMYAGEGPFLELLREKCPILKEEYRPPPLVHESRLMTIVAALSRHRGLSYPFLRENYQTIDGGEIALDWWDARFKPKSLAEVPVVPSSTLVDSLSYYYHNLNLPHLRFPNIQMPHIPHMRIPKIDIPYFGPLKRSASATGNEFTHMEARVAEGLRDGDHGSGCDSSPDPDIAHQDVLASDEGGDYGGSPQECSSPDAEMGEAFYDQTSDVPDLEEATLSWEDASSSAFPELDLKTKEQIDGLVEAIVHPESSPNLIDTATSERMAAIAETKGIVLILPGLTGDSTRNYVQGLVQVVEQLEYTAVVMNYRGATGSLKSCFMADTSDVAQVIKHLKLRYPSVPIVAVGVSLGGILLTNYVASCGKNNEDSLLLGVMTVSVAWNFFVSAKEMEQPLNWLLFNRMLTRALCDAVQKHSEILQTAYDLEGVQDVRTLREFDERFTSKMFGYTNVEDYYKSATPHEKVGDIRTPLLAINAADDAFSPYAGIPKEEAKRNPNVCIIVTSHGGHIGFLEGRTPFGTNYVERVFIEFAKMLFDNQDKVIASPVPPPTVPEPSAEVPVEISREPAIPLQSVADIVDGIMADLPGSAIVMPE